MDKEPIDVLVLTPLPEELRALRAELGPPKTENANSQFSYVVWRGVDLKDKSRAGSLVAVTPLEKDQIRAGTTTHLALMRWLPRCFALIGIAGQLSKKVRLGDVVVGRHVLLWDTKRKERAKRGGERGTERALTPVPSATWGANLANLLKSDSQRSEEWRARCAKGRPSELEQRAPELHVDDIASGSATIDSKDMVEMLSNLSRYLYVVETEAAAALTAFHSEDPSAPSILIRGVSDPSAGKSESDAVGQGAWRRYAARNAAKLLVLLLSSYPIPYEGDLTLPAWIGYKGLDVLVPHDACRVVLIGQNLSSRLGLNPPDQEKFSRELLGLVKRGTEVWLVIMPPSVLKDVHLEAAEDLANFTLPALEGMAKVLGRLRNRVKVVFHPAATLSLLAVDGNYGYITPKFQKTADISRRLTIKLERSLFDAASLERMLWEAERPGHGALALPLDKGVAELRNQLIACGLGKGSLHAEN